MFCNLFFLKEFRDHNFSDFWVGNQTAARIDRVTEEIFAGYLRQSFRPRSNGGGDLPPDFDPIVTLTLSPKCCASFMRTNPDWPYDERDYYLTKLYQFVLAILDEKFKVWQSSSGANEIGKRVEALLDLVPPKLLPPSGQTDWLQFFWQVWRAALTGTLDETLACFEEGIADLLGLTPAEVHKAVEDQGLPTRRYGPQPDVETHLRVHTIVSKYANWKGAQELEAICRELIEAEVPVPPSWKTRRKPAHDWVAGLATDKEVTVKAIEYRFRQGAGARSGLNRS